MSSGSNGFRLRSHLEAGWTSGFCRGAIKPSANAPLPSSPKSMMSLQNPFICFCRFHIRWRHWRERIRVLGPSGWVRGCTSLSAHGYRIEGEPSVQAMQGNICTRWTRLLGGWTSGFGATLYGCASGFPGQDARQWGSRSGCSFTQGPEKRDRPGSTHHQSHHPSHWAFDVQPDSVRVPPLAHDDGDERGVQSSLSLCSGLVRQPVWTSCGGPCRMLHGGSEVV